MSDLLSALLVPKSSQESFHSASSQPTIPPSPTAHPSTQHTTLPTAHNGAPIHLYDVHTFLSSTATATAPSPTTSSSSSSTTATNRPPGAPLVPVPLGTPHSAASVSRLHELCQEKGLSPVFAIEEDPARAQWFRGSLSVGAAAATLVLDASQPTKKEARQLLAAQGCELVRGMPARVRRRDDAAAGGPAGENWVGKLLEFSALTPALAPPTFADFAVGLGFGCECRIAQRPGVPFGGTDELFGSKKAAKAHAAREAVAFLVQSGELDADGNVRTRKKKLGGGAVRAEAGAEEVRGQGEGEGEKSWGERVVDLCALLGLHPPTYRLAPVDPAAAPHVFSGAAYFEHEPLLRAPVGAVRNVYGRRNAREESARGVVVVLEGMMRAREGAGGGV